MIKIEKNDSIVDILGKISKEKNKKIVLQFPFGHPVLHNYLSLKIIQTKVGKKQLLILTNDKTSKKIGKLLKIKYAKNKSDLKEDIDLSIKDILKDNYTFGEYALFEIKKYIGYIKGNIASNKKINSIQYYRNKHKTLNKNIIIYFLFILIGIFLILIYIYYFAINKTIIELTPEVNVAVKSRNYNYIEKPENIIADEFFKDNEISLEKISKTISIRKNIGVSGIEQKEDHIAKGEVILYNLLAQDVNLLKNTTLENELGIQFQTNSMVTIPSSSIDSSGKILPGVKHTTIYGKIKLLNGDYSGEQTNIGTGVFLTIPKLNELKSKIFAKTTSSFSGGTNDFIKILLDEDLENAKKIMEESLKQEAISKINNEVKEINKKNNIQMAILGVDNIYKFKNMEILIPEHLQAGDRINEFEISGKIQVSSYIYNKESIISKLQQIINDTSISSFEKILSINPHSLRISHVIKRNDLKKINGKYTYLNDTKDPLHIKGTTEIEYYVSKNFESTDNNYINKLKYSIAGKTIEDAEKYLINNPEINNVKIIVQPFFLRNISNTIENISVKISD